MVDIPFLNVGEICELLSLDLLQKILVHYLPCSYFGFNTFISTDTIMKCAFDEIRVNLRFLIFIHVLRDSESIFSGSVMTVYLLLLWGGSPLTDTVTEHHVMV